MRKKATVKDMVHDKIVKKIGMLMANRRRVLAPFPVDPGILYRLIWTDEERAAIRLLARRDGMLREGTMLRVRPKESNYAINITLPRSLPMTGMSMLVPNDRIPPHHQLAIDRWVPVWQNLHNEQVDLLQQVKTVGSICKTYGHLHRLWPELESFYDDHVRVRLREAKSRSPYPPEAVYRGTKTLREYYRPELLSRYTSMIAECLMLPEHPGPEIATISV